MQPSDLTRRIGVALALALTVTACVSPDDPGVSIEAFEADLVFGFEEPAPVPAPPNFVPAAPPPAPASTGSVPTTRPSASLTPTPTFPPADDKAFLSRIPPTSTRKECPPAAREAFPAEVAGLQVMTLPKVGLSRWKQSGTQTIPNIGELPIQGFENRTVTDVELLRGTPEEPLELAYRTTQPEFSDPNVVVESGFRLKTDGTTARNSTAELLIDRSVAAGEPDRGLVLESIDTLDRRTGDVLSSATYNPPVLYLPLQVFPGEEYQSVGIDPRSGATLQHTATVVGRTRVDACGDVLDGWLVEATQVFSGPGGAVTREYDYVVATQFGGLLVSERVQSSTPLGAVDVTFDLGQLEPLPLPDAIEGEG